MQSPEQAIVILNSLHEMGICLALDDYGTGYSSLAYLKRFPFDRLKIDRSFIDGIPDDADDMSIVQTTIIMARQLRLSVIAEGVETQAQCDFLKEHKCEEIQGYLFAKPMSAEDVENRFGFIKPSLN
jgi:EAL domain-containing protein (putative c-di-GMP-specific phosphodiesterase class I)